MAQPRARRLNSFASIEYDLTDRITAFADFSYWLQRAGHRQPDRRAGLDARTDEGVLRHRRVEGVIAQLFD